MSVFGMFKRSASAPVARERLQVLLAHERTSAGHERLVEVLRDEILAVIARHVAIEDDKVSVELERHELISLLRIDIELSLSKNPLLAAEH